MERFLSRWFGPAHRPTRKPPRRGLRLEELESRTLLSITAFFSGNQLVVNGDGSGNTIRVDKVGSGDTAKQRISYFVPGNGWVEVGQYGGFSSLLINAGTGNNTVNIDGIIYPGSPLMIHGGGGHDAVNLNSAARNTEVANQGLTGSGATELNIADPLGLFRTAATVGRSSLTLAHGPAADSTYVINYYPSHLSRLLLTLGNAGNTVVVNDTPEIAPNNMSTTIHTGKGDQVSVLGIASPLTLVGHDVNTIGIGNAGHLTNIRSSVRVFNLFAYAKTDLTIDNALDTTARSVSLSKTGITGLAPEAAITWGSNDLRALRIHGGNGGNAYTVLDTPASDVSGGLRTSFYGGAGVDTLSILATTGVMNYFGGGGGGLDLINVGNAGRVQNIKGSMTFSNDGGSTRVNINDENDPASSTVTLDTITTDAEYARITGSLMPATIYTRGRDTSTLNVSSGSGGATVNVLATATLTNVIGNGSATTVNVGNAGRVQDIRVPMTVSNSNGRSTVNVNDQNDPANLVATLDIDKVAGEFIRLTHLAPAGITSVAAQTSAFVINSGRGDDIFKILSTAAGATTTINGGDGSDFFVVGGDGTSNLAGIAGQLRFDGQAGGGRVWVNDTGGVDGRTYTLNGSTLSWGDVTVEAANVATFEVSGGQGDDAYRVQGTNGTFLWSLDAAGGTNTLTGPDTPNIWNLAAGADYSYLGADVGFRADLIQNLVGGANADTFVFSDGFQIAGAIDGGGGANTLHYSAYTSNVLVNLQTSTATGVGGGIANIQNVIGGNGGPAGTYNILVGNGGNVLTGGNGRRNLLIAGGSASQLFGGNDEDILIGGTTAYDTEAGMTSLQAIMAYWTGADDFATRVNNLTNGIEVPLLDATMVQSNGGGNTLSGSDGLDLFFGSLSLDNHDKQDGEVFIEV